MTLGVLGGQQNGTVDGHLPRTGAAPTIWDYVRVFRFIGTSAEYAPETPFDDTIYTYGTDFILALATGLLGYQIYFRTPRSALTLPSSMLMAQYSASALVAGILHFAVGHAHLSLNSTWFRVGWIIVVGCVATPNGIFGLIGNALIFEDAAAAAAAAAETRSLRSERTGKAGSAQGIPQQRRAFMVHSGIWILYGLACVLSVGLGIVRCSRPAADIFIMGICQACGSLYLVTVFLTRTRTPTVAEPLTASQERGLTLTFVFGFLANSPLIIAYPIAVVHGVPLEYINFTLHINLLLAWGSQGLVLKRLCEQAKAKKIEKMK